MSPRTVTAALGVGLAGLWLVACGPSSEDLAKNLGSDNPAVREDTAKIARNFGSPEIEAALVAALDDPVEAVRLNAVESLIILETAEAVPVLVERLGQEPSAEVQREMVDALGRLGDVSAVPVLIAYVEAREADPPLNAIWALGVLEDSASLPLLARLRESEDPYVRYSANEALRNLRPAPAPVR